MKGDMAYIRDYYGVPAKRGKRIRFAGHPGVIVGARHQWLRVRLDDGPIPDDFRGIITIHAKWLVEYDVEDRPS